MKKLFRSCLLIFCLLMFGSLAHAGQLSVQSHTISNWQAAYPNVELWIFTSDNFIDALGQAHLPSSPQNKINFQRVPCTVNAVAKTLTISAFTLTSTLDARDNTLATYSAWFYTTTGTQIAPFAGFDSFSVPVTIISASGCSPVGTCATWADLREYNFQKILAPDYSTYTKEVIEQKLASAISGLAPQVTSVFGRIGAITLQSSDVIGALGFTPVTNARTLNTTGPLGGGGDLSANRTLSITKATGSVDGYLAAADFASFAAKQSAGNYLVDPSGNGLLSRSSLNTTVARSIAVGSNLSVTNADGTAGNPTISLGANVVTSVVNDTNITGAISSNALTFTWSGTLAKSRQHAATAYTDQANTFGAFVQTFQAGANHLLVDPTDTTKKFQFDVSNVASGNTRTVNIPNANSTTVQADTGAANQFLTAISAQGVISKTQPAFSNLSGSLSSGQDYTTGVSANTYRSVTVNTAGRITGGTNPTTFSGYAISDTSANLASAITDETGSGALVFGTSPTFTTQITTPVIVGGSGVSSTLTLKGTSNGSPSGADVSIVPGSTDGDVLIGTGQDGSGSRVQIKGRSGGFNIMNVRDSSGNSRFSVGPGGDFNFSASPATSGSTQVSSPSILLNTNYWNGSASVTEHMNLVGVRAGASAGAMITSIFDDLNNYVVSLGGSGYGNGVSIGYGFPNASAFGQLLIRSAATTYPTLALWKLTSQTADLFRIYDTDGSTVKLSIGASFGLTSTGRIVSSTTPVYDLGSSDLATDFISSHSSVTVGSSKTFSGIRLSQLDGTSNSFTVGASSVVSNLGSFAKALSGSDSTSNLYTTVLQGENAGPGTVKSLHVLSKGVTGSTGVLAAASFDVNPVTGQGATFVIQVASSGINNLTRGVVFTTNGGNFDYGLDFVGYSTIPGYNSAVIRLPNDTKFVARNAANSGDVEMFKLNSSNEFEIRTNSLVLNQSNPFIQVGSDAAGWLFQKVDADNRWRMYKQGLGEAIGIGASGIFYETYGGTVASAATLTITGNTLHISGTTTITSLSTTNLLPGSVITLIFDSSAQVADGGNLKLAGNFTGGADRVLRLVYDGTSFLEVARSSN